MYVLCRLQAPALNVQSMLSFVYDECEMDRVQDSVEQCINGMITAAWPARIEPSLFGKGLGFG